MYQKFCCCYCYYTLHIVYLLLPFFSSSHHIVVAYTQTQSGHRQCEKKFRGNVLRGFVQCMNEGRDLRCKILTPNSRIDRVLVTFFFVCATAAVVIFSSSFFLFRAHTNQIPLLHIKSSQFW